MRCAILSLSLASALLSSSPAFAQVEEKSSEHKTFSGVHELIVDNVNGFIEVTGSSGGAVEMEISRTVNAESNDRAALAKKEVKLDVAQEGGLVRLMVDGPFRDHYDMGYRVTYDFTIKAPRDIRLDLRTAGTGNDRSHITVQGTSGDFKIGNVNGGIEMRGVEGAGSVHTVNGPVKVTFAQNPKAPVSFKSVNGTLDVVFRPDLNADVRMKTLNGGFYTDFQVMALPVDGDQPEHRNGKRIWRGNRITSVRIGGGGPELNFETVNGDVLIKNRER